MSTDASGKSREPERKQDFLDMAKNIILINDARGRAATALKEAGRALRCQRGCLVLKGRHDEFTIAEGFPGDEYKVGQKVSSRHERHFLMQILDKGLPMVAKDSASHQVMACLKEIVRPEAAHAMLFAPLFHEGAPLGIVVLESPSLNRQRFSKANYRKITTVIELVTAAVARENVSRRRKEEQLRRENFCALGEYSAAIMHTLRNHFTAIGGAARRMQKLLRDVTSPGIDEVVRCADTIAEGTERLERVFNSGLRFVKFSSQPVRKTKQGLNAFLRELAPQVSHPSPNGDCKIRFILDRRLDDALVCFNREMLGMCITDLISHAAEAQAGRIKIQTKLEPSSAQAIVILSHTGERMDPLIARDIFNPFMTTKGGGSGLGVVAAIVRAHGGEISLYPGVWTQFKISLPLR